MKKYTKNILSAFLAMCILLTSSITVLADSSKVVTLGENLSTEQRQLILNYFGVTEQEVDIVTVTNSDEHRYLDGVATQQQIGTRTFSCTYIEPTNSGGINIKTVNLNWVTCDMIRNALITSGITNCNIICASPIEVSGTGSLTGIFMAYENVSGEQLSEEKIEIASEELITTMNIAEEIGQDEASTMLSELKEEVIVNSIENEEEIQKTIEDYIEENKIELTEEQKWALIDLLLQISEQDYDIEDVKQAYEDIKDTAKQVKEDAESLLNWFEKLINWIKTVWQKITGTYEEIQQSEEYQIIQDKLGIIAQTNDELLTDNTVVTTTDNIEELTESTEIQEEQETKEEKGFLNWIKSLFSKDKQEETEPSTEESEELNIITFENFSDETVEDEVSTDIEEAESETSILDSLTYEFPQETIEEETEPVIPSFDDITN